MMKENMWDNCGEELGALKNEADDAVEKRDLEALKATEGGMIHFDELILGGCKFYALRKGDIEIAKCKGFKKSKNESLKFEHFETMDSGGEHEQKQVQFLCPKSNHLSENLKFALTTPSVSKKFRFDYRKGNIMPDKSITPFYY